MASSPATLRIKSTDPSMIGRSVSDPSSAGKVRATIFHTSRQKPQVLQRQPVYAADVRKMIITFYDTLYAAESEIELYPVDHPYIIVQDQLIAAYKTEFIKLKNLIIRVAEKRSIADCDDLQATSEIKSRDMVDAQEAATFEIARDVAISEKNISLLRSSLDSMLCDEVSKPINDRIELLGVYESAMETLIKMIQGLNLSAVDGGRLGFLLETLRVPLDMDPTFSEYSTTDASDFETFMDESKE